MGWADRIRDGWHWVLSTPTGQQLAQRVRQRVESEMDRAMDQPGDQDRAAGQSDVGQQDVGQPDVGQPNVGQPNVGQGAPPAEGSDRRDDGGQGGARPQ